MSELLNPDAELLRLGAGNFYWNRFTDAGVTTGWRHLGNVDTLEPTTTDDIITRRSSMSAARPIRKRLSRQRDVVWRAVGDEWNSDNLALMMMGDVTYVTIAATAVTDQVVVADVPASTLGAALGNRYFWVGAFNIGTVTMKVGSTALDTDDFTVANAHMGLIYIKPTAPTTTNGTDDLTVTYTPQAVTGQNQPRVRGGTKSFIYGSFMFVEDNSAGQNRFWMGWNASVTPDGAFGLIQDDWGTFALQFTLQDDSNGAHGGSPTNPLYFTDLVPAAA